MATATQANWHPAACIFPMPSEETIQELADDIREHGQQVPIVLMPDGSILDGRSRSIACTIAGVEPWTELYEGDDPVGYSVSMNLLRRHLTSSQGAIAAAKAEDVLEALAEEAKQRQRESGGDKKSESAKSVSQKIDEPTESPNDRKTDAIAAKQYGTNRTYVNQAKKLTKEAPDLAEKVERGELKVTQATNKLRQRQKSEELKQKAEENRKKRSDSEATELAWHVEEGDVIEKLCDICGHVEEPADWCSGMDPPSLIIADPPYNIGVDYGQGAQEDRLADEDYLCWTRNWLSLCHEALDEEGAICIIINDEYAHHYRMILEHVGFTNRNWIIWHETFGVQTEGRLARCHRHVLHAVKGACHTFDRDAALVPSDRQIKYNDSRASDGGKVMSDVWSDIPRLTGTSDERMPEVPTQIPVALLTRLIKLFSVEGDTVLDPFNGSGSTGEAALKTNREYVGIELNDFYAELSRGRLEALSCEDD